MRVRVKMTINRLLEAGWTKEQIAGALGVSWRTIHRWSRGDSLPVTVRFRQDLLKLLQEVQDEVEVEEGVRG